MLLKGKGKKNEGYTEQSINKSNPAVNAYVSSWKIKS